MIFATRQEHSGCGYYSKVIWKVASLLNNTHLARRSDLCNPRDNDKQMDDVVARELESRSLWQFRNFFTMIDVHGV